MRQWNTNGIPHTHAKKTHLNQKRKSVCSRSLILFFGILFPPETSYPFIAFISLDFLSFLCCCTRRFEDGVVRQGFGGDVFEEGVRVEVVRHPFVEVCFFLGGGGRGMEKLVDELR